MSWTTLITDDNNPIKNLYINNENVSGTATINNLEVTGTVLIPDMVTDTTDMALSIGNVMIGNGTKDIKESGVNIDSLNNMVGINDLIINGGMTGMNGNFDDMNTNNIYNTNLINTNDIYATYMRTERLSLDNGTNDIIFKAEGSTGIALLKYGNYGETAINILPNISGIVAVSGGSQNVSFGTITGTTGTIANLTNVSKIYGQNGGYIEFDGVGGPPIVRAIAPSGNPWQIGGSDAGNLNRQISAGYYLGIDRGLIYAFDQLAGIGKNMQYGFPSIPVTHYFEGTINPTSAITMNGNAFLDSSRNITAGTISGTTITSTSNSLNGITIPATGGTLAKLSDIPGTTDMVTSTLNITSNTITTGDGGARGIKGTAISIVGSDISGISNVSCTTVNSLYPCGFQANVKGMICGDISSGGTVLVSTGGFASVTHPATGQYLVTLNATSTYGATANCMSAGQYNFVTIERQSSVQYLVVIRTAGAVGQDADFSFSCAYN